MKQRRDETLLIRISRAEKNALKRAAEAQEVPASQFVRRAIKTAVSETRKD